jgi:dCTP deaminase
MASGVFVYMPKEKGNKMTGVLPNQQIQTMIARGHIVGSPDIIDAQIQPASLDLRLGTKAWRVRASFLAGNGRKVLDRLGDFEMHQIDLTNGAVLEKGCVYVVPLMESLSLPDHINAVANAKSSTGRLDLLTRVITDDGTEFDRIPRGYSGPLYAEICPRSFSVLVRPGMRLNQIRFRSGQSVLTDTELHALHVEQNLVSGEAVIGDGLGFSVDLRPDHGDLVGYRAKPHTGVIDLDLIGHYAPRDYWEEIHSTDGQIILDPVRSISLSAAKRFISPRSMPPKWRRSWRWLVNSAYIMRGSLTLALATARQAVLGRAACLRCVATKHRLFLNMPKWLGVWSMNA